jgi:hypothetical protein
MDAFGPVFFFCHSRLSLGGTRRKKVPTQLRAFIDFDIVNNGLVRNGIITAVHLLVCPTCTLNGFQRRGRTILPLAPELLKMTEYTERRRRSH